MKLDKLTIKLALERFMQGNDRMVVDGPGNDLSNLVGSVKSIEFKDDGVYADVDILPTPKGNAVKALLTNHPEYLQFVPFGIGRIIGSQVIDYEVTNISVLPTTTD